ncbi:hypothetical protein [Candidatus Accumulibacter phosphatis]|uniref:hypothetical protein n=1 Tax=Candidatus Accumulibacter phosphatis TaxID=327160 RepID=UPI00110BFAD1|nr:hypothetical protein [Candidatus Accumulibacter phosphatis]
MNYHPAIAFVAPYRIYLPDEFFDVLLGGSCARVKAVPLPPIAATDAPQVHGQNVEVSHDIFGFAGRTKFYVVLGESVDITDPGWKQSICTRDHALVASALGAVNRMVAVYRDIDVNRIGVSSFHVIELVRGDLSDISLVVVDEEFNQISDFAVIWPGYRTMGFGDAVTREAKVVDTIRTCLASGTEIPIERELLTSARNHHWRRQLRLVPVEANTAFESYAFSALKRVAPGAVFPDSIDVFKKLQELDSAFATAATTNSKTFSRWFDPAVQGWKGLLCAELIQWHSGCYELRNKVIHRGYNAVTDSEADAAIKHTVAAISMVEKCIETLIP